MTQQVYRDRDGEFAPPEPRCVAVCACCGIDILADESYYAPNPELPNGRHVSFHMCGQCMEDSEVLPYDEDEMMEED
jgi:hypothetical protein